MMKYALAVVCATAPIMAQDVELSLFLGREGFRQQTNSDAIAIKPDAKTIAHVRVGYTLANMAPLALQATVGYQPKITTPVKFGTTVVADAYEHEQYSLGAMLYWKPILQVGAGVEYRWEKLNSSFFPSQQATTNRPWLRANVSYAFSLPLIKPFVGIEAAVPITSEKKDAAAFGAQAENTLRALAPSMQAGLYAGIRF